MHDIVTIASLVEREAQRDDERARIAGVIYNRLNNSSEFPYLQVDASVLYGLGRTGGKLSDEDLKSDSEYNLYNHEGLPPEPGLCFAVRSKPSGGQQLLLLRCYAGRLAPVCKQL